MHAALANTIDAEQTSGFDKRARIGRFVVAYPDGVGKTWNAYGCCGDATEQNVDDIAFTLPWSTTFRGSIDGACTPPV